MTLAELNLLPALPEIFLLAAVSAILVIDLFLDDAQRHWSYWLTLLGLAITALLTIATSESAPTYAFNGMYVADQMTSVLKLFSVLAVGFMLGLHY